MNKLLQSMVSNGLFVLEFFGVIVSLFLISVVTEKVHGKKQQEKQKIFTTRKVVVTGMFSAIASVLMLFDFPLPFAPGFYELDFSELPVLVGAFAFGPTAGVMMEFVKILLKLLWKGTSTAFVGELANFVIGCSLILPASMIYLFHRTKKGAVTGCIVGTICITVFGSLFNAVYLLPAFSKLYGIPLESILEMGQKVNPLVTQGSLASFVAACVAPLNLLKGSVVCIVTMLIYKPLRPIMK